jgi:hypothetical protein
MFLISSRSSNHQLWLECRAHCSFSESLETHKAMFDANSTYATCGRDLGINNHHCVYAERKLHFPIIPRFMNIFWRFRRCDEIELHIASYTFRRLSVLSLKPEPPFPKPPRYAVL